MPNHYPKFYFYDGPWENSDSPSIVMEDPNGGDWIILATLRVIHRPDDLHDMCIKASSCEHIPTPAQQTPVAWRWKDKGDMCWTVSSDPPDDPWWRVEPLYAAQPAAPGETDVFMRLVDWAYLHATEGEVWPSTKTKEFIVGWARSGPPTQRDADVMKKAAPQHSSAETSGQED